MGLVIFAQLKVFRSESRLFVEGPLEKPLESRKGGVNATIIIIDPYFTY